MSQIKRLLDARSARMEVKKRLAQFAKAAPEEIVAQMNSSAGQIAVMMRQLCPVGRTGRLRRSIGFGQKKDMPEGAVLTTSGKFGPFTIFIWAGSRIAYYARWVEFGTQGHSLAKGASVAREKKQSEGSHHGGSPAQPFFWPAWRAFKKEVKSDMRRAYKAVGKRVFGNAA